MYTDCEQSKVYSDLLALTFSLASISMSSSVRNSEKQISGKFKEIVNKTTSRRMSIELEATHILYYFYHFIIMMRVCH